MKKLILASLTTLLVAGAAFAEAQKESLVLVCKNFTTNEVIGGVSVVKEGVKITIMDAVKVLTWDEIELLKKTAEKL